MRKVVATQRPDVCELASGGHILLGSPGGAAGQALHREGGHLLLRRPAVGAFGWRSTPRQEPPSPQVYTLVIWYAVKDSSTRIGSP